MICHGMEPIKNVVLGKEFYYCRECKQEVKDKEELVVNKYEHMNNLWVKDGFVYFQNPNKNKE